MTEKKMFARINWAKKNESSSLNFSYENITYLPEDIYELNHLHVFNLKHNQISDLPESIDQLCHLQSLLLTDNQLDSLPESIGKLSELHSLYVNDNHLGSLPETLGELSNLQALYLNDNHLTTLPDTIGDLSNLQSLFLSGNHLTTLPESIGNLSNLHSLYLNDNHLTSLPRSIGKLTNLQSLYLSANQLTCLPDTLGNLRNLQILNINNNQLTHLPIELKKLKKLDRIKLKNNPLSLPEAVYEITNAQYILDNFIFVKDNSISRYIELPAEYAQIILAIVNYFITILDQKHPDIPCKIQLENEKSKLSLNITPPEDKRNLIDQTLIDYGLLIMDEMKPDDFFHNQFHLLKFLHKLDMIKMELQQNKDILIRERISYNEAGNSMGNENALINEEMDALLNMLGQAFSSNKKSLDNDEESLFHNLDRDDLLIHKFITMLNKSIEKEQIPSLDELKEQLENFEEKNPNILNKLNCYFNNHFHDLGLKVSLSDITLELLSETLDSLL